MVKTKKVGPYLLGRTLGEGSFGKVRLGIHTETHEHRAIKVLKKERLIQEGTVDQVKLEISVMKLIRHRNVVNLIEVLSSPEKLYMVMELVTGGELFWLIIKEGRFNDDMARNYFHQLIDGVEYCHSQGVSHRDLKPENLLIDNCGVLKISDFGLSALHSGKDGRRLLKTQCGTANYAAPEVLRERPYDGPAADVWSCGVILYVFLSGKLPFDHENEHILKRKVMNVEITYPSYFSADVKDLLRHILKADPTKRYCIADVKRHRWFQVGYRKSTQKPAPRVDLSEAQLMKFEAVEESTAGGSSIIDDREQEGIHQELERKRGDSGTPVGVKKTNAFDIINMSGALDMTRMLRQMGSKEFLEKSFTRFTTKLPPSQLIEQLAKILKEMAIEYKLVKSEWRFKCTARGMHGVLTFRIEVMKVAKSLYLVNFQRGKGSILDYYHSYEDIANRCKHHIINRPRSCCFHSEDDVQSDLAKDQKQEKEDEKNEKQEKEDEKNETKEKEDEKNESSEMKEIETR